MPQHGGRNFSGHVVSCRDLIDDATKFCPELHERMGLDRIHRGELAEIRVALNACSPDELLHGRPATLLERDDSQSDGLLASPRFLQAAHVENLHRGLVLLHVGQQFSVFGDQLPKAVLQARRAVAAWMLRKSEGLFSYECFECGTRGELPYAFLASIFREMAFTSFLPVPRTMWSASCWSNIP